jgi:hypothetical protein
VPPGLRVLARPARAESPWLDLWPNITVDLFSVWLVARIIESFITSRERRRDAALDVRGAMNCA